MLSQRFCTATRMVLRMGSVHTAYMVKKRIRSKGRVRHRPTYIRQWRKYRGLTLDRLAERVGALIGGFTHASLSRIERGLQGYTQPVLEAIAEALSTDATSLLMRDPTDPEGIWSIWDNAKPGERRMIVDIARTVIKTGTHN